MAFYRMCPLYLIISSSDNAMIVTLNFLCIAEIHDKGVLALAIISLSMNDRTWMGLFVNVPI